MSPAGKTAPATFFLNEQHELSREAREGGGRQAQYYGIDWAAKGQRIRASLLAVSAALKRSTDPVVGRHYYVLAKPAERVEKKSSNKRLAPDGIITAAVRFDEDDSRAFRRLGIDLVDVTAAGDAIVHIERDRATQLQATTSRLDQVGSREQARWVSLDTFELIPADLRLDPDWVRSLPAHRPTEAVIEFQPLLSRTDVDDLIRTIAAVLRPSWKEALVGLGADFSGRFWVKGNITPESLRSIAVQYYSVQTLHAPLLSSVALAAKAARRTLRGSASSAAVQPDTASLPTVAILDTGVAADHSILARYRRGQWIAPDSVGQPVGDHGSFVASRVVFGDIAPTDEMLASPPGGCLFYDALVAIDQEMIDDKSVYRAIESVTGTAPDVRVFNLSFDTQPLPLMDPTRRRENLLLVQDLDNLIFRDDIIVVISAGNSPRNTPPAIDYPRHYDDPNWQLGAWARSFNSLTCGSFVGRLTPGGLVAALGWPSPFTRVGPGTCDSPKPDFSESGGNGSPSWRYAAGLGVSGLSAAGFWEDRVGTSFAAPVLAREAAFAIQALQKACLPGARPYAVTTKAFLILTATPHAVTGTAKTLAFRALGRGRASASRLKAPLPSTAVLIWQGLLEAPREIARVTIPIPRAWYEQATAPHLRLVAAWDSPVNAAVSGLWATRKVSAQLKASPDSPALHGSRGDHHSYPVIDRTYDLRRLPKDVSVSGDTWLLELSYDQIADYHAGMVFTPQQRLGVALELFDASEDGVGPQSALQTLPVADTMVRLSISPQPIKVPVLVRPIS
jgi:hypothetical protein